MALKPGDSLGSYTILEEVGHGGMATVYRAHQPSLRRDVAIKVLPEFFASDEDSRERFAREAATVAQLRHPNIVAVFDYGEEEGVPYIVTEFLSGQTLASRLGHAFSVEETLTLIRPVAAALDYAHQRGVVHRDVKPSNIIVTEDQGPVLTDFGLARLVGSLPRLTRTGTPIGTPEYMAPEMAAGDVATAAVDRYALGIVAYEMLTGTVPYTAETPLAVLLAHLNRPLPRPSRINASIGPSVEAVLEQALEKSPEDRFATATAFVDALELGARASAKDAAVDVLSRPDSTPAAPTPPNPAQGPLTPGIFIRSRRLLARDTSPPPPDQSGLRAQAIAATAQYPPVLLGLAAGAIAATYLLVLSSVAGGAFFAVLMLVVAVAASAGLSLFRYPHERDVASLARERQRVQELHQREAEELEELTETLRTGFTDIGAAQSLKALTQLSDEFGQIRSALERRSQSEPLAMAAVRSMTLDTYHQGLSVLLDVLDIDNATRTSGIERLRSEIEDLSREIEDLRKDPEQAERLAIREARLQSHKDRLAHLGQLQLHGEKLLFEAQRCEAALHLARIDIAAIRPGRGDFSADAVVENLRKAVEQARAVQEEFRRLGLI